MRTRAMQTFGSVRGDLAPATDAGADVRVLEKLNGWGQVRRGDEVLIESLAYHLTVIQDSDDVGTRQVHGSIDVTFYQSIDLMADREPLTLHLEDGRTLQFQLATTRGQVLALRGGTLL